MAQDHHVRVCFLDGGGGLAVRMPDHAFPLPRRSGVFLVAELVLHVRCSVAFSLFFSFSVPGTSPHGLCVLLFHSLPKCETAISFRTFGFA